MGQAVLLTFSTVGSRLPWSYLHTGTLTRLISFVSHSYENCRVCTQNSHSGSPRAKPRGTPSCVLPNVPSTRLGAGIGRFLRSVHSAFSVISALNPSFPFFQFSTVNFQPSHHPSSLAATLMDPLASVANTRLTLRLSPLDATLTKNRGRVGLVLCLLNLLYILYSPQKRQRPFRSDGGSCEKGAPSSGEKHVTGQRLSFPAAEAGEAQSSEIFPGGLARWCSPRAPRTATPLAPSAEYSSACRWYFQTGDPNACS